MSGLSFLNAGEDFQVLSTKEENILTKLYKFVSIIMDKLVPLGNDVEHLKARYDYTISGFFVFFRFLVGFSMLTALVFAGLLIYHMLTFEGSFTDTNGGFYPSFTLFSSFTAKYATTYAGTIQLFMIFAICCSLSRWIRFFKDQTRHELYENKNVKYSKLIFNWWDWTMCAEDDCSNLIATNLSELKLIIYEESVMSAIAKRTIKERLALLIRRLSIFL